MIYNDSNINYSEQQEICVLSKKFIEGKLTETYTGYIYAYHEEIKLIYKYIKPENIPHVLDIVLWGDSNENQDL